MPINPLGLVRARGTSFVAVAVLFAVSAATMAQTLSSPGNLRIVDDGSVPPPGVSTMPPLSWDDPRYSVTTNSGSITLSNGQSVSNRSINDQSGNPTISCQGSCNIDNVRITTREGPRCAKGTINLTSAWIETKAANSSDHSDGLQCYNPGATGTVTVKDTTFRGYPGSTHTGYWSADDWRGTHHFENVLFWGADFGLRIPYDGGTSVSLKNVYFVKGSFGYAAFSFDAVGGQRIPILQWENVRWVTITSGKMVIGDLIPKPY